MKKPTGTTLKISADYRQFIEELKARVTGARTAAARAVNNKAILLYWDIGHEIVEKQQTHGWGDSVVEMIAADLRRAFPGMRGFSANNVWLMRQFFSEYSAAGFLEHLVQEMGKERRPILRQPVAELETGEIWLQPAAKLNVDTVIPFLRQLVAEIPWGKNLLILNKLTEPAARLWYLRATARFGWSRNVLLNQIKAGAFEPEHAGKMDFYLNLLNDKERGEGDQPSIGIILCAEKDDVEVEYALRTKANPIGVAVYELQSKLPGELKGKPPTAKQLADVVRVEMGGEQ
jgi:predicted nuclease of restriction endonuclease-like (RecB) superfamily